jgi:ABC-type glycerol-3-phosphate transport system substrate-binding protein
MRNKCSAHEFRAARGLFASLHRREIDRREFLMLAARLSTAALFLGFEAHSAKAAAGRVVPFYSNQSDPRSTAFFTSAAAAFQKTNPDTQIAINFYDDSTAPQFLSTAFQARRDVGIFTPPPSYVPVWASNHYFLPLDDVVQRIGSDGFLPGTRAVVGGHDYSIPYQSNATGLWYRKDLFAAAGIRVPVNTYANLVGALSELNGKNGVIGIGTGVGTTNPNIALHALTPYVEQSGWGYFSADGKLTFNRTEVLEGVKRFVQVLKYTSRSMYSSGYSDWVTAYVSGRAALCHFPGRVGNTLDAQNPKLAEVTGFMPEPGGPFMTGKINFGSARGYSIYARTAYPREAKAFLESLATGENGLAWSLTLPGQVLPPLKSLQKELLNTGNPMVAANAYLNKHRDWIQTMLDLVPTQANEESAMGTVANRHLKVLANPNPFGNRIWKEPAVDAIMIQRIMLEGWPVEKAWQVASEAMDAIAKEFFKENPSWKPPVTG